MRSEHAANLYLAEQAGQVRITTSRTTQAPIVRPGFLVALASSLFLFLSV